MSPVSLLKEFLPRWKETHDEELTILRRMDSDIDSLLSVLHDSAGDHELYYTHYEEHYDSMPDETYEAKTLIAFTKSGDAYHVWSVELLRNNGLMQILEPKHILLDHISSLRNFMWEDILEDVVAERLLGTDLK